MKIRGYDFPDELWYLPEWDTWARLDADGCVTVGITSIGVHLSGEMYMCRPKSVGIDLEQGRSVAVAELAKSVVSVKSPVHGVVVQVNPLLEDKPDLPFRDPYGEGWLARVKPTKWDDDCKVLKRGEAIRSDVEQRMYLYKVEERSDA